MDSAINPLNNWGLVVSPDQSCGVPGRYIGDSVAFLRDFVSFASSSGTPVAVLSLDQEKALDRVDWGFLRSTLVKMGFGPSFIVWVDLFYSGVQSAVMVNGYLSPFFGLSRGVRQGCPLSPLLYVLYSEVLACNIRSNSRTKGLSIPGSPTTLSPICRYADDSSLVVTSDDSIRAVFDTYRVFELGSSSRLNQSKSRDLWLGSWNGCLDPPVPLEWSSSMLKVLGIFIGPGASTASNWRPRITAVENVLNSWRQRNLSYRGKSPIINALALSRIWYVASLVYMPVWVLRELDSLVFRLFWKGKCDLVARTVVSQPYTAGGFSLVSISYKVSSLLVQWVRRLVTRPARWIAFLFFCRDDLRASPFDILCRPSDFNLACLPSFYSAVFSAWQAAGGAFSRPLASLAIGCLSGIASCPVASASTNLFTPFFCLRTVLSLTALSNLNPSLAHCTGCTHGSNYFFLILIALSLI